MHGDSSALQLWCAKVPVKIDPTLAASYKALLSTSELAHLDRLRLNALRVRYLVTRALVRTVLSRYAPIAPQDWAFTQNEYGRPAIADLSGDTQFLRFNVSHAEALVVLVVANDREVGVDVECTLRHAPLDLAPRIFSRHEVAELYRLPPNRRTVRFWELWTLKESYIKARGIGLSLPLDVFTVSFDGEVGIRLEIPSELDDSGSDWHLWQFSLPGQHLMALCAQKLGPQAPGLCLYSAVPLRDEQLLACRPHRTSL